MTDFGTMLQQRIEDTEKPKPLPVGPYNAIIQKFETGNTKSEKKTPYVRFTLRMLSAREGVDQEQLQKVGDYSERTFRYDFYTTPDAMWRFRDFLEKVLKLDCSGGRSYAQVLPETQGKVFVAHIKQSPSSKPNDDSIFNEVESAQAAE